MFSFEKSVGGVIYKLEDGQPVFLLLHYVSGHWDFVKGHQEKGENDEETLRRETREETGIDDLNEISKSRKQIRFFYRAKGDEKKKRIKQGIGTNVFKKVVFYSARTRTEDVRISHEHIGYVWLSFEEAMKKVTFQNARNVLSYFHDRIGKTENLPNKKELD